MRLICPNCHAQYEVDDSVIPHAGRDVQCSNCGQTWFQAGPGQALPEAGPEPMPEAALWNAADEALTVAPEASGTAPALPEDADGDLGEGDFSEPAQPASVDIYDDELIDEADAAPADDTEDPILAAAAATVAAARAEAQADTPPADKVDADLRRRSMDVSLLAVLREEAEREARARKAEGSSLEMQPELGLDASPTAKPDPEHSGGADRVAHLHDDPDAADDATALPPRRERLPDIEQINSTLRATSERGAEPAALDAPETLARHRSGFRLGFGTMLMLAAMALALYSLAPRLATALPGLAPSLEAYVLRVDAGRLWLDQQMRALTESIQGTPQG